MRKQVLIPKATAAVVAPAGDFYIPANVTIAVDGSLASNTIPIHYIGANGTDLTPVTDSDGEILLSATKTGFSVFTPCHIRIGKGITTNAVGINMIIM
jgi:hypothetical protein